MTLAAGVRLGPYQIVSPLGAGGTGEIYRAWDTRLEHTVAVKVPPSHLSASARVRQRFEQEARTISQFSHRHICALYDVGREGETEYLVMGTWRRRRSRTGWREGLCLSNEGGETGSDLLRSGSASWKSSG